MDSGGGSAPLDDRLGSRARDTGAGAGAASSRAVAESLGLGAQLRAWLRIAELFLLAVGLYSFFLVTVPFRRGAGSVLRWRVRLMRVWARSTARIIGMRLTVRGVPPSPPFVLVTNHLGYMDFVLIAAATEAVFVSRADVRDWPIMGRFGRAIGTVFLDRRARRRLGGVVEQIQTRLGDHVGVVFFPEGTSTAGDRVLPFRPPLLEAAVRAGVPVSYATLSYDTGSAERPASRWVCWWGDMTFPGHIFRLFQLPGFRARIAFGDRTFTADDRKALAIRLHGAVEEQFRSELAGEQR